ncbi:MAG TPA: single-stranded DNA-binding protein [Ktedonobacteraceae bacterium]|jgi:single-strand DNA-binding protein
MNKIILIGNLGKDPDMSYTNDGTAVTRFSLAVNRRVRSSEGEWQKETDWFNIVAFRQLAETCNTYLRKGSKIFIEGRVQQRKYTGQDGIQRTAVDVIASDMEMLTPKSQQSGSSGDDSFLNNDDLGDLDEHPF